MDRTTAENWYRGWKDQCVASGYPTGMMFEEFISQVRAEGAMSMLAVLNRNDPTKYSYDPDAELLPSLKARLAIADAWLRGELDRRPMPKEITRTYSQYIDYELPELPEETG
jgi:hypothetical protein